MDEIGRKLDLIDRRLSRHNLASRLITTAPLLLPVLGLMVGIVLQGRIGVLQAARPAPVLLWAWLLVLCLSAAGALAYLATKYRQPRPEMLACGAALCCLCLGALRLIAFTTPAPQDIRHLVGAERRLATIRGRIATEPCLEQQDWAFARFDHTDPSTAFYLQLEEIETATGWRPAAGTVRVRVGEPAPNLHLGDSIQAYCWLHRLEAPGNPGQFNVAEYLRRRNVLISASIGSRDAVTVRREEPPGVVAALRGALGRAATRALLGRPPSDTPGEGLLEALLLGQRRNIDRKTYEAFRRTGLLHFLSLSGLHFGILVWTLWWLGKTAGLLKPARAIVCMGATLVFLLVVPPRAPSVRTTIIVWVYCAAILMKRQPTGLNSLCLAAIILLLIRPTELFEVGWQLSFAAVAGVILLTDRIDHALPDVTRRLHDRSSGPPLRIVAYLCPKAKRLLATGLAAWLGGAGILLYHFHGVTPLASIWTVLAFPLVAAILVIGFFKITLFFVLPTLSALLYVAVAILAHALIAIVKVLAKADFNYILVGHVSVGAVVFYYALVLFALFVPMRCLGAKRSLCTAAVLVLAGYLGSVTWQRTHRDCLSLTCLDVGHGQAILVRLPGSANILFDAGSLHTGDVGTRVVLAFLDYAGIACLHAVVLSHHDVDHINGIPEIAARCRLDRVYATDDFLTRAESDGTACFLAQCLQQEQISMERVPETTQFGPITITTLWPVAGTPRARNVGDNDGSLVTLIEYAGTRILLCSDIEQFAQQQVLALYPGLKADVVVVPHHGSVRTLDPDFLGRLHPSVLLCSCGQAQQAGTAALGRDTGASLLSTAANGAITICVDKKGMVDIATHLDPSRKLSR